MRTFFVVLVQALPGKPASLGEIHELLDIQQLVTQAAEERFGEAVFPRSPWLDVQHFQSRLFTVSTDRVGF